MTDHQHNYLVGNEHCKVCYERRDAIDVKLDKLQAMAEEAMAFARDVMQQIEDEADDRMHHAEWQDGAWHSWGPPLEIARVEEGT